MFILILGGFGALGTELSILMSKNKIAHACLDREQLDITNEIGLHAFFKNNNFFTHVVNCAAFTNVVMAEDKREDAVKINRDGARFLAQVCKKYNKPLLHFSSVYVYAGLTNKRDTEDSDIEPLNFYGKTKAWGDQEIQSISDNYKILRIQSLYSKFGPSVLTKVWKTYNEQGSVNVVDDQFFSPCSTYFVAQNVIEVLKKWEQVPNGIYNLAHEDGCSAYDFVKYYFSMTETKGKNIRKMSYKNMNFGVVRPNYTIVDCTKYKKSLGIDNLSNWKEDLDTYRMMYGDFHKNGR